MSEKTLKVGDYVNAPGGPKMEIISFTEDGTKAVCIGIYDETPFKTAFPLDKLTRFKRSATIGRFMRPY